MGNVELVAHDNNFCNFFLKVTDLFGEIKIGRSYFIGVGLLLRIELLFKIM